MAAGCWVVGGCAASRRSCDGDGVVAGRPWPPGAWPSVALPGARGGGVLSWPPWTTQWPRGRSNCRGERAPSWMVPWPTLGVAWRGLGAPQAVLARAPDYLLPGGLPASTYQIMSEAKRTHSADVACQSYGSNSNI